MKEQYNRTNCLSLSTTDIVSQTPEPYAARFPDISIGMSQRNEDAPEKVMNIVVGDKVW